MTTVTAEPLSWWQSAACQFTDPDDFFPDGQQDSPAVAAQIERAKQVCAGCPVRMNCLDWATERHEKSGIWGGTTENERHVERRRTNRRRRAAA